MGNPEQADDVRILHLTTENKKTASFLLGEAYGNNGFSHVSALFRALSMEDQPRERKDLITGFSSATTYELLHLVTTNVAIAPQIYEQQQLILQQQMTAAATMLERVFQFMERHAAQVGTSDNSTKRRFIDEKITGDDKKEHKHAILLANGHGRRGIVGLADFLAIIYSYSHQPNTQVTAIRYFAEIAAAATLNIPAMTIVRKDGLIKNPQRDSSEKLEVDAMGAVIKDFIFPTLQRRKKLARQRSFSTLPLGKS